MAAWASTLGGCAYAVGRAPVRSATVHLEPVVVLAPEIGLREELEAAVARELDRLGAGGGAMPLNVAVTSAAVRSVALGAAVQEARLTVSFSTPVAEVSLSGRRAFALSPDDPAATAAARAQAYAALADELVADGLRQLLLVGEP